MEKTLDFEKDIKNWVKEVRNIPGADDIIGKYERGYVTLRETYLALRELELEHIKNEYRK